MSPLFPPGPLAIGLGVPVAMLICQLMRASEGAKVAGYICGIVLLDHGAQPWQYAFLRCIETALGVVVAWLISTCRSLSSWMRITAREVPRWSRASVDNPNNASAEDQLEQVHAAAGALGLQPLSTT